MLISINNHKFNVKVCSTPKEQKEGMQNKKFDHSFNGMLFLMDGEAQSFWMKDCLIPLDIIMIQDGIITKINHNCPPCHKMDCPSYHGIGNVVLELKGGTCKKLKIVEGDTVNF